MDEEQENRLTQLQSAFGGYSSDDYTAQDREALSGLYSTAADDIRDQSEADAMDALVSHCVAAMAQVPTLSDRVQEIVAGWQSAHSEVLALVESGQVAEPDNGGTDGDGDGDSGTPAVPVAPAALMAPICLRTPVPSPSLTARPAR